MKSVHWLPVFEKKPDRYWWNLNLSTARFTKKPWYRRSRSGPAKVARQRPVINYEDYLLNNGGIDPNWVDQVRAEITTHLQSEWESPLRRKYSILQ